MTTSDQGDPCQGGGDPGSGSGSGSGSAGGGGLIGIVLPSSDSGGGIDVATPGGPAQAGDNCTPVNGYAIGFALSDGPPAKPVITAPSQPLPGNLNGGTITNQRTVMMTSTTNGVTGKFPVGWILTTAGIGYWFVPNLNFGFGFGALAGASAVPGAYSIGSKNTAPGFISAISAIFNTIASANGSSLTSSAQSALHNGNGISTVPCFTSSLT